MKSHIAVLAAFEVLLAFPAASAEHRPPQKSAVPSVAGTIWLLTIVVSPPRPARTREPFNQPRKSRCEFLPDGAFTMEPHDNGSNWHGRWEQDGAVVRIVYDGIGRNTGSTRIFFNGKISRNRMRGSGVIRRSNEVKRIIITYEFRWTALKTDAGGVEATR
jgi:hypothetical protein